MSTHEILRRASATFVQAATAQLIAAGTGLLEGSVLQHAAVAGVAAVVSLAHRLAGRWLEANPE